MTGSVQNAATKRELLDALLLRLAVAFDKASPRDLIALSKQMLDLLRLLDALDHEEREDAEAAARDAEAAANATTEEDFREWIASLA